jgi:hypothetical protein
MTEAQIMQYVGVAVAILVFLAPAAHSMLAFAKGLRKFAEMTTNGVDDRVVTRLIEACEWCVYWVGRALAFLSKFTAPPARGGR